MINGAPIHHMIETGLNIIAAGSGSILAAAAGLPIRRRIIRRWSKKGAQSQ